ncbi:MAG TPA: hypothetical protein VFF79_16385 [Conexibacter sp.]|jgi:hypothetical protein|nr:hypothetical protein [Conexibacter sp.]
MSEDPVRAIAQAVLYEGYVLWPYRRGALKNAKRWTFGGVYPPQHSRVHPDDPATMRTQCLIAASPDAALDVTVRFLHVVVRQPLAPDGTPVDVLEAGGERHVAWEEACEREVTLRTRHDQPLRVPIAFAAGEDVEPLAGGAALARSWEALSGTVTVVSEPLDSALHRLTVAIANTSAWAGGPREAALQRAFVSTHTVLRCGRDAAFISLTDPPAPLAAHAEACQSTGTWPVLVGDERTLLSAPIVLPDHPQIAPESPGDLFDGGEVDGLLILGVLSLTEQEQREAGASDPRVRELLERCAQLPPEQLAALHAGAIRERRPGGTW